MNRFVKSIWELWMRGLCRFCWLMLAGLLPKLTSIITLNNWNREPWSLFIESFFGVQLLWIQGNSRIQFKTTVPCCLLRVIPPLVSGCLVNGTEQQNDPLHFIFFNNYLTKFNSVRDIYGLPQIFWNIFLYIISIFI